MQLLCTFAHQNDLEIVVDYIRTTQVLIDGKVFVFKDKNSKTDLYCTYNVD